MIRTLMMSLITSLASALAGGSLSMLQFKLTPKEGYYKWPILAAWRQMGWGTVTRGPTWIFTQKAATDVTRAFCLDALMFPAECKPAWLLVYLLLVRHTERWCWRKTNDKKWNIEKEIPQVDKYLKKPFNLIFSLLSIHHGVSESWHKLPAKFHIY